MEMEPVLAIYAGYSLDHSSYPEDLMGEVLQSALDELEYCTGNTSTKYGALRAEHGRPEPFKINYVELGNEDWFSSTYPYRFPILYNGVKEKYPNITLISTAFDEAAESFNYTIDLPKGSMWDRHHYEEPHFYLDQYHFYDNWQQETNNTDVKIFLGEYSVFQVDTPDGEFFLLHKTILRKPLETSMFGLLACFLTLLSYTYLLQSPDTNADCRYFELLRPGRHTYLLPSPALGSRGGCAPARS